MTRVAVVGANGQVGAEVCLRLREADGVEVVPIVRNVSGSAFLRLNGMECRHGRISDTNDAKRLLGDCDVVVNFALSTSGIPRVDRENNRSIVRGVIAGAKAGAPIVFASTIMVYAPAMTIRIPDAYGLDKLATERLLRRLCRASHRRAFVLRLGHVLGDLQNVSRKICDAIRDGEVALPNHGLTGSNSVFTATIVEAIVQVARGAAKPGTYDLVTSPQWNWRKVYEHYAAQIGCPLRLADPNYVRLRSRSSGSIVRRWLRHLAGNQFLRERLLFLLAYLPAETNQRIHLRYLQTRAMDEINALRDKQRCEPSVPDWRELTIRPMPQLPDPQTLLLRYPLKCTLRTEQQSLASELP